MRNQAIWIVVLVSLAAGGTPRLGAQQPTSGSTAVPTFARPQAITHPYLPLASLKQDIFEGKDGAKKLRVVRIPRPDLSKSFPLAGQTVAPLVSAHERSDLIEDLNEEGYSDRRYPGIQDLPLILIRISLIERLAPHAMDKVNADAFQEAYKDLVNMARRLAGQTSPK